MYWETKERLYYTFRPKRILGNIIEVAGLAGIITGVTYTEHDLASITLGSLVILGGKILNDYKNASDYSSRHVPEPSIR